MNNSRKFSDSQQFATTAHLYSVCLHQFTKSSLHKLKVSKWIVTSTLCVFANLQSEYLGKGPATKSDEFLEKFQRGGREGGNARKNAFFPQETIPYTIKFLELEVFVNFFRVVIRLSVKKDQNGAPFTFVALIE